MQVRRLIRGSSPLLISIPHTGTYVPSGIKRHLSEEGLRLADTDWHVERLYDFASGMGAGMLSATHSRYVIDLNRPPDDEALYPGQHKTGLCPLKTFAGEEIYLADEGPDEIEKPNRVAAYWLPYHETLQEELSRLREKHGYAILYDAHSIRSECPLLFEGKLPDLSLGTAKGISCAPAIEKAVMVAVEASGYSCVLNGRFVGGYITRYYGRPQDNIHAIQMELAQANYMNEDPPYHYDEEKAPQLQKALKGVISALLEWKP